MEQTNNNCGENLMSTLTIDFSEIVDNGIDSEDEDEDKDCCKLCLNICRTDDMCNHGIGSGRCCVCQECFDEMEKEDEDSDEECNEDDDEIVLCRCCRCDKWKFIDDIVCIEIQPYKIWKCCDCIAMEVQMNRVNIFQRLVNKYK